MQTTTEEVKRIDIRYLKKIGALKFNCSSVLTWSVYGEPSGSISYTMTDNKMTLSYKANDEFFNYDVALTSTPCHFGGSRKWLHCPHCDRRVGILYLVGKLFRCRKCARLPYTSNLQTDIDRMIDQKHKLGNSIFENYDGYGWRKKKGLHQKTFDRKRQKYIDLEMAIDKYIYQHIGQL